MNESHNHGIGLNDSIYYTYNNNGQLTKKKVEFNNRTFEIEYSYDEVGNRKTMVDPENGTTTYSYDVLNRVINITNPYDETTLFEYNNRDQLANQTYSNGILLTNTYNYEGLLVKQNYTYGLASLLELSYKYDSIGRMIERNDRNGTTTYGYDNDSRLINVSYPWNENVTYIYDGVGNRLNMTVNGVQTNYTYNKDNQLSTISDGTWFTYDDNGNMIRKTKGSDITNYTYNYENQLVEIEFPNKTKADYIYYSSRRRLAKEYNNKTINYFYDDFSLIIEWNETFVVEAQYTYNLNIDDPISLHISNQTYFYLKDYIGSIISITNQNGTLIQNYTYDTWGTIIYQTTTISNSLTYTSREYDYESGLYYYRNRYYSSGIARFIQRDLIGILAGPNFYVYVNNNPINYNDPYGLAEWWDILGQAKESALEVAQGVSNHGIIGYIEIRIKDLLNQASQTIPFAHTLEDHTGCIYLFGVLVSYEAWLYVWGGSKYSCVRMHIRKHLLVAGLFTPLTGWKIVDRNTCYSLYTNPSVRQCSITKEGSEDMGDTQLSIFHNAANYYGPPVEKCNP